jgi:hypothetical protein
VRADGVKRIRNDFSAFARNKKGLRNRDRLRLHHLVAAFEDDSFVDTEARGQNITPENRRAVDFHSILRADRPVYFAADNEGSGFNIAVNTSTLADDQGIRGKNLSPKRSADPDRALKAKLSFKLTTVFDNPSHTRVICRDT